MSKEIIQGFQLSPQQNRLWQLQQSNAGHPNVAQCAVSIEGSIEKRMFIAALEQVVQRHEILRTTFQCLPGMTFPLQIINEHCAMPLDEYDLSNWEASEQDAKILTLLDEAKQTHFDFERGPLMHVSLIKLGPDRYKLIITLTTLYADRAGLQNLIREIMRCYPANVNCEVLDDQPLQYADLSQIYNELLEAEDTKAGREYWEGYDLSDLHTLKLFVEKRADGEESFIPQRVGLEINSDLVNKLEELAREGSVLSSTFLLSCWQILLWRLSGQTRTTVGSFINGRNYEELEASLGPFARCLPVQVQLTGSSCFNDVLQQIDETVREVSKWQESFTWEQVIDAQENLSAPFFPFCFDYEPTAAAQNVAGVTFSIDHQFIYPERFKLMLTCSRLDEVIKAEIHYDPRCYQEADVRRMGAEYQTLVRSVLEKPQAVISELEIVSPGERQQLLVEWNDTAAPDASDDCVHQLFERQAKQSPAALALVYEEQQVSYAELNRRANQLAHYLRELGVGAEVAVGLCLERSLEMIVGLLGILKAGAAYLPLDPTYPGERLSYMLRDAGAPVVVTQQHLRESLPESGVRVVCLDGQRAEIAEQSCENPEVELDKENLAYLIYTSGSTGRPKGVAVTHQNLVNYVQAIQAVLNLEAGASYATVSTLAADLGNTAIYPSLCGGGRLHVISGERAAEGALLGEYFSRHQIDVLKIVPSHLEALLASGEAEKVLPRRRLVVGGEASRWEMVAKVKDLQPECVMVNHYGPTEATVGALTYQVADRGEWEEQREWAATVPLGRPLGNVQAFVLDQRQRPLPVGVSGEIYLGGAGVSRGYLNRPDLTAERYVPDPFSEEEGRRLYRTGDLGRYLSGGELEFLGRVDGQVKLRGYRIELGEIEASLRGHEAVESAVVVAREDQAGGPQLVGYVVAQRKYREVIEGRRRYLLPNGMAIVQQNKNETDYQYQEIFSHESYLRHGIRLEPEMCVFDVGANIGMFTMYVSQRCPEARIYAFEPIGEVCAALRLNAELYGAGVKVFECGLSDREREESFTYYPRQTMMSGQSQYADTDYEKEVVKRSMRNAEAGGVGEMSLLLTEAEELLVSRFETQSERCRLRRLSEVMREEGVERIDLLKVDVQRAEMDVLLGIEEADWSKIRQVVMEVHDRPGHEDEGRLQEIGEHLRARGFEVVTEQEEALQGTDRYNLYAIRLERAVVEQTRKQTGSLTAVYAPVGIAGPELRRYLRDKLPDYMVPTWIVMLDELPLTRNGKLDRRALPAPALRGTEQDLPWRTPTEEIVAGVWAELFKVAEVDAEANFFELGGHSLLATQVVSRLRAAFGVEVHLRSLFERPTVRGLAEQIDEALKAEEGIETPPLRPVERNGEMPLSYAQQRLWFLDQLDSGNSFYNLPTAVRLTGLLNISALEQTLTEIIRRHEVLRTSFSEVNGRPVQVIAPAIEFTLPVVDLSHFNAVEREVEVMRRAREEATRPFDMTCERPLLRATLLKLEAEEQVVLFTMHHIVSDGWSVGVLLKEVAALYEAYSQGKSSPLPELAIQYADYAIWQREWLQGEALERQLSYWKRQLDGATSVLELPTDRPRPSTQTFRGAHHPFSLTPELSDKLRELSRDEDVTLFMTLLAAWQTLLHRYTNQEQITVGTPIANRNRPETEMLIGFFVNTLVINNDLSGDPSFRELLRRVREVSLGAYTHQDVPFEKLVEVLQPERSLSHTPLIQVWFAFQNAQESKLELPGLSLTPLQIETGTAKFDLVLSMADSPEGLFGTLEYKTDLFNAGTARRISSQFETLLQRVATHPEEKLSVLANTLVKAEKKLQREELQASKKINLDKLKGAERRLVSSW